MAVSRIERVRGGIVLGRAEIDKDGTFKCLPESSNMHPLEFSTLDEVADFLRTNSRAGVRMNPGWSKIVKHIFIDGVAR